MSVSVFVPGHITGFFNIENHADSLKNGSCGAGFLLSKGVTTTIKDSGNDETSIKINGKIDLRNETIVREVLSIMDIYDAVDIAQEITLPIGAGYGTSAAAAIGTAMGVNRFLDLDLSPERCGQIAHLAEVNLGSGLGDVIAELGRGIVLRTRPGAPGIGKITSFDEHDLYVGCRTFGEISTSSVIGDAGYRKVISQWGLVAMDNFLDSPTVRCFLRQSHDFSRNTGLMSSDVSELVERLNGEDGILGSSMAMLGNTAFAFAHSRDAFESLDIDGLEIYELNNEGIVND